MSVIDLKNKTVSVEERVQSILTAAGYKGDERTVTRGLRKGDIFSLINLTKNIMKRENQADRENALYATSVGANFAPRHLSNIVFEADEAPRVGTTSGDNAIFLVYCADHDVTFKCVNVKEEMKVDPVTKNEYTAKEFIIAVDSFDGK